MSRFFLILTTFVLLQTPARAEERRYWEQLFRLIPEEEAHVYHGRSSSYLLNPNSIRAFVWNIKKAQLPSWKKEFEAYAQNQDLILIQEAYHSPLFKQTTSSFLGFRWDMAISMHYILDNDAATGTMIGSHVHPTEVLAKHSPDGEAVVNTPKSMIFAKYPIRGRGMELLAISVHGINITHFEAFKRHMDQAFEQIANHSGPVLFAGDFNTRTAERTRYVMAHLKRHGLKPVVFKNGHERMRWKFTMNYLDHGFVRGLKVKNAYVDGKATGSDHKPLFLELAVD